MRCQVALQPARAPFLRSYNQTKPQGVTDTQPQGQNFSAIANYMELVTENCLQYAFLTSSPSTPEPQSGSHCTEPAVKVTSDLHGAACGHCVLLSLISSIYVADCSLFLDHFFTHDWCNTSWACISPTLPVVPEVMAFDSSLYTPLLNTGSYLGLWPGPYFISYSFFNSVHSLLFS
jgi:hypothetical protein